MEIRKSRERGRTMLAAVGQRQERWGKGSLLRKIWVTGGKARINESKKEETRSGDERARRSEREN